MTHSEQLDQPSASATSSVTLRSSALNLLAVAGLGAIIMSPAIGIYFNPVIGIGINLYVLWQSFFVALLGAGFTRDQSVVLFALAWCIIALAYVVVLRVRASDLFHSQSYILPEEDR